MTDQRTASQQITEEVTSWPGVAAGDGRRGEFAFKLGGREIGHLHGDHAAHFMFPKEVWLELREQRRIVDHPVFPGQGWASGPQVRERGRRPRRDRTAAASIDAVAVEVPAPSGPGSPFYF
jgi:hypothetical protein